MPIGIPENRDPGPYKNRKTGTLQKPENQDPSGTLQKPENPDPTKTGTRDPTKTGKPEP